MSAANGKILNGLTPVKLATGASLFSNVPGKVDALAAELEGLTADRMNGDVPVSYTHLAAGQIECGFVAEGIFHTGIQRTVGGGKQVAFDSHFLCGNGKGAAEQKTRKDIPGFHILLYIGLIGFKEYFQVIGGFFRAFGFGCFQQANAFVGVVAQQFVGATAVLVGKRFMGSHLQIAAGCLCVAPVSYTHLDVYKRQVTIMLTSETRVPTTENQIVVLLLIPAFLALVLLGVTYTTSVSYTHLDVYKRQSIGKE